MVPRLGLEPRIYSLEGCCLIHSAIGAWWALQDSNLRPSDYESPALTTELKALLTSYNPDTLTIVLTIINSVQAIITLILTLLLIQPQIKVISPPMPHRKVRRMHAMPSPVLPCWNMATQAIMRHTSEGSASTNWIGLFQFPYYLSLISLRVLWHSKMTSISSA